MGTDSFLLTNKKGGYLFLSSENFSKYNGAFYRKGSTLYKAVEDIRLKESEFLDIEYHLWMSKRIHRINKESFFLPEGKDVIIYKLERPGVFELILDCKNIYENHEWGRNYEISEKGDYVIIRFTQADDPRNRSHTEGHTTYVVFHRENQYRILGRWDEKSYPFDQARKSSPYTRYVYAAAEFTGAELIVSYSHDSDKAIEDLEYARAHRNEIKIVAKNNVAGLLSKHVIDEEEINTAYLSSVHAIDQLGIRDEKGNLSGIYAGLPWFFQFWARDELIITGGLIETGNYDDAIKILIRYAGLAGKDGRIPNRYPGSGLGSADGTLWLAHRFRHLIQKLKDEGSLDKHLPLHMRKDMIDRIEVAINRLAVSYVKDNLMWNNADETWMDTSLDGKDKRDGARIEIQALLLSAYRLLYEATGNFKYKRSSDDLVKAARGSMLKDNRLWDGAGDPTQRPNIFIAAYAYPELLSREEWTEAFENSLSEIWLDWGGLSSISKNSELYMPYHTGEDNRSYHRGDSWYYINNMAAIAMHRINMKAFEEKIAKILHASTEEILSRGIVGFHAEISDASKPGSTGCLAQGWSSAMYIELVNQIRSHKGLNG